MKRPTHPSEPVVNVTAIRSHWSSIVLVTCMRNAALLNIVPWGEASLRALPDPLYEVAFRKCAELRDDAVAEELRMKGRPTYLEQQANAALWQLLKPFAKAGEHYLGHLSAEVPRGTQQSLLESDT